jgi:hypothetical protein
LALLIVDRTHAACGFGMEAPSAAISPLGLVLDLMWHNIFTRMHRRRTTRSGGASTCLAGAGGWTDGCGSKAVARSVRRTQERERKRRRKTKGNGVNPAPGRPIYRGSTESIRCGSFHRTIRLNGSIPRSSRED